MHRKEYTWILGLHNSKYIPENFWFEIKKDMQLTVKQKKKKKKAGARKIGKRFKNQSIT